VLHQRVADFDDLHGRHLAQEAASVPQGRRRPQPLRREGGAARRRKPQNEYRMISWYTGPDDSVSSSNSS